MLNVRLYRTCWLVAGVALIVALLTLETPDTGTEPALPSAIDGQGTLDLSNQLTAIGVHRPAGSTPPGPPGGRSGGSRPVPGGAGRVQTQDLVASSGGGVVRRGTSTPVPGTAALRTPPSTVVLAPRDTLLA